MMSECQECNHECHCGGICNEEDCDCVNCQCDQEWADNPMECHEL